MDLHSIEPFAASQLLDETHRSRRDGSRVVALLLVRLDVEGRSIVQFLEVLDQRDLLVGQVERYHIFYHLSRL